MISPVSRTGHGQQAMMAGDRKLKQSTFWYTLVKNKTESWRDYLHSCPSILLFLSVCRHNEGEGMTIEGPSKKYSKVLLRNSRLPGGDL